MTENTALAAITEAEIVDAPNGSALVLPVADPQALIQAMRQYQATKNAILERSDFQNAGKTDFVKKSGWAKLAIAFGVSSRITDRRYDRDADGHLIRAELIVTAEAPNGRFAEGLGVCHIGEERFTHGKDHPKGWWKAGDPNNRDKIEHDLPATAETRARNRAYSALFGHGEVSWEEVDAGGGGVSWDQEPADHRQPGNRDGTPVDIPQGLTKDELLTHIDTSLRALSMHAQKNGANLIKAWRSTGNFKAMPLDDRSIEDLRSLLAWSEGQLPEHVRHEFTPAVTYPPVSEQPGAQPEPDAQPATEEFSF